MPTLIVLIRLAAHARAVFTLRPSAATSRASLRAWVALRDALSPSPARMTYRQLELLARATRLVRVQEARLLRRWERDLDRNSSDGIVEVLRNAVPANDTCEVAS